MLSWLYDHIIYYQESIVSQLTSCICIIYVGVGMFLKEKNPAIKVVLADPQVHNLYVHMYILILNGLIWREVFCIIGLHMEN